MLIIPQVIALKEIIMERLLYIILALHIILMTGGKVLA